MEAVRDFIKSDAVKEIAALTCVAGGTMQEHRYRAARLSGRKKMFCEMMAPSRFNLQALRKRFLRETNQSC